jgi:hypothetical protein
MVFQERWRTEVTIFDLEKAIFHFEHSRRWLDKGSEANCNPAYVATCTVNRSREKQGCHKWRKVVP